MRIEEEYQDVLQNIEFAIVTVYKNDHEITDFKVMSALEALISSYTAEITGKEPGPFKLSPQEQVLFERIKEMCEWRLGRINPVETEEGLGINTGKKTVEEIILCLKRILKSVKKWNREGGQRGYLDFVIRYF